jgi:hypothetical protein
MKWWMPHLVSRNSIIPALCSWFFTVAAVAFGPFIFIRDGYETKALLNHERIHIAQQYELLFVGQWVLYGVFWLINLVKYRDARMAYLHIPFEQEAYARSNNDQYLKTRKLWSWVSYI